MEPAYLGRDSQACGGGRREVDGLFTLLFVSGSCSCSHATARNATPEVLRAGPLSETCPENSSLVLVLVLRPRARSPLNFHVSRYRPKSAVDLSEPLSLLLLFPCDGPQRNTT